MSGLDGEAIGRLDRVDQWQDPSGISYLHLRTRKRVFDFHDLCTGQGGEG